MSLRRGRACVPLDVVAAEDVFACRAFEGEEVDERTGVAARPDVEDRHFVDKRSSKEAWW